MIFDLKNVVRYGKRIRNVMWASIWSKKAPHVRNIHAKIMDRSNPLLFRSTSNVHICHPNSKSIGSTRRRCRVIRDSVIMVYSPTFQLCISVSYTEVPSEPAENRGYRLGFVGGVGDTHVDQLVVCV